MLKNHHKAFSSYLIFNRKRKVLKMLALFFLACLVSQVMGDCTMMNFCNGHGTCDNSTSTCNCYEGWGASTDITFYRSPDCSLRTCPSSRAWADVPTSGNQAHAVMECSNRGTCDKSTALCSCFPGFTGAACERTKCPNDCSGHGVCLSMKQLARMDSALPLAPNTYYEGDETQTTWDEDKIFGCLCDSTWTVGLGDGETQEPEWFGPDCSLKHCPSGDNLRSPTDDTDCFNVTAKDSIHRGEVGNLCHVDCSNQGICDHTTGICQCFDGQYGNNCQEIDSTVTYDYWKAAVSQDEF